MANEIKKNGVGKGISGAVLGLAASKILEPALEKAVNVVGDKIDSEMKNKSNNKKVIIPDLYKKGFPLTKEQATDALVRSGLSVVPIELTLKDADIRYKDCIDNQVIDSNPKHRKRIDVGGVVYIKYVTHEVIVESQRMFAMLEMEKQEAREQKIIKTGERKEKIKNTADKTKRDIVNVFKRERRKGDNPADE